MRLYDKPKCLADLEIGDVVYTRLNGKYTQAKVTGYRKFFHLTNKSLIMEEYLNNTNNKSYVDFITPSGVTFRKIFEEHNESQPYVYNSLEDLRSDNEITYCSKRIKTGYGYVDTYNRGDDENKKAVRLFALNLRELVDEDAKVYDTGELGLWRNNNQRGRVEEIKFDVFVDDSEYGMLQIGYYNTLNGSSVWGAYDNLIASARFYTTYDECYEETLPKVETFDVEETKLPQDHFIVFKRFFEHQEFANDELVGIYDNLNEAVATASMKAYTDNNAIADGLDSDYYYYIVFPCDKNGDGTLDNEVFETPWYSDRDII